MKNFIDEHSDNHDKLVCIQNYWVSFAIFQLRTHEKFLNSFLV